MLQRPDAQHRVTRLRLHAAPLARAVIDQPHLEGFLGAEPGDFDRDGPIGQIQPNLTLRSREPGRQSFRVAQGQNEPPATPRSLVLLLPALVARLERPRVADADEAGLFSRKVSGPIRNERRIPIASALPPIQMPLNFMSPFLLAWDSKRASWLCVSASRRVYLLSGRGSCLWRSIGGAKRRAFAEA